MTIAFGARLAQAFDAHGQLCLGIDPHPFLLEQWGLEDGAPGLREFALRVLDAAVGQVGIIKPQVAFFERHGAAGYLVLEELLAAARAAGLLVIADAKRGDVGSTVEAYARAWLTAGSPLEADAMTVTAYQGVDSLAAPITLARVGGKGLFVLAATSNPESFELQQSIVQSGPAAGRTVAAGIVDEVAMLNSQNRDDRLGSIGVVLGATVELAAYGIELSTLCGGVPTPILAPGFGHQGAKVARLGELYGSAAGHVIVSVSRSILSAGPGGIAAAVRTQATEVAQWHG